MIVLLGVNYYLLTLNYSKYCTQVCLLLKFFPLPFVYPYLPTTVHNIMNLISNIINPLLSFCFFLHVVVNNMHA